jgi:hypothetical protein
MTFFLIVGGVLLFLQQDVCLLFTKLLLLPLLHTRHYVLNTESHLMNIVKYVKKITYLERG